MPRSALEHADFLLPHLTPATHLLDVGCGDGELTLDLAGRVGRVTGVDLDAEDIEAARAAGAGAANVEFRVGDLYALDLPDGCVDVVLAHSVLEQLDRPMEALVELRRVLRPGGVVAVACVEYGGLVLGGPFPEQTRRFYAVREQLWLAEGADPYRGRSLRGLLTGSGFVDVRATTKAVAYGTAAAVAEFGVGRAEDCRDPWYVEGAVRHGLASPADLEAMRACWLAWAESPAAYASFSWCRALGVAPGT